MEVNLKAKYKIATNFKTPQSEIRWVQQSNTTELQQILKLHNLKFIKFNKANTIYYAKSTENGNTISLLESKAQGTPRCFISPVSRSNTPSWSFTLAKNNNLPSSENLSGLPPPYDTIKCKLLEEDLKHF